MLSVFQGLAFRCGCGGSYGKPGVWLGGFCPELPLLMQARVSVTVQHRPQQLTALVLSPALSSCLWHRRAQLCLPPDLLSSLGLWFGLWQKL